MTETCKVCKSEVGSPRLDGLCCRCANEGFSEHPYVNAEALVQSRLEQADIEAQAAVKYGEVA